MRFMIVCMALLSMAELIAQQEFKEIQKNQMVVRWKFDNQRLYFEMEAPTNGWVTIGFNETSALSETYLLMGRVQKGQAEIVEHYTSSPGNYRPIGDFDIPSQVSEISGMELKNYTKISGFVPINKASKYHKNLSPGSKWTLLIAYSLDDDFQHHSIMRTSIDIEL